MSVDINVETDAVLSQIDIGEIITYYGEPDLLDAIGESEAKEHFNLESKE